jgi:hypothetical protein
MAGTLVCEGLSLQNLLWQQLDTHHAPQPMENPCYIPCQCHPWFRFALDFGAERIQFDLFRDIGVCDTGTAESAERVHEVKRFEQDYFGNGQLHIVNTDTGELIGRKDAYIPVNMYLDGEGAAAELARWKSLAQKRRERERSLGDEKEPNACG